MKEAEPEVESVETSSARFGITANHAYQLIAHGKFPARTLRLGHKIVVLKRDVDALLGVQEQEKS